MQSPAVARYSPRLTSAGSAASAAREARQREAAGDEESESRFPHGQTSFFSVSDIRSASAAIVSVTFTVPTVGIVALLEMNRFGWSNVRQSLSTTESRVGAHDRRARDVIVRREFVVEHDVRAAEYLRGGRVDLARVRGAALHVVVDRIRDLRARNADRVGRRLARHDAVLGLRQDFMEAVELHVACGTVADLRVELVGLHQLARLEDLLRLLVDARQV